MEIYPLLLKIVGSLWELAAIILVGLVLEQYIPAEPDQPFRISLFKIRILVVFTVIGVFLGNEIALLIGRVAAKLGGDGTGLGFGVDLQPRVARIVAGLMIFDFFYYWYHRLQHQSSLFWQQHKLHHADPALNVTSATFHHWLEGPLRTIFISIPMSFVIKLSPEDLAIIGVVLTLWAGLKHANVRVPLGLLTPIVVGPQLHRLHHSIEPQHRDRNFAAFFPIYDVVFGSYCGPQPSEWPATGLPNGEWPKSVAEANLWPFVAWWGRIAARRAPADYQQASEIGRIQVRSDPSRSDSSR